MKKFLYFLVCIWGLLSCSGDSPESPQNKDEESKKAQINLDVSTSNFTTDGGSNTISFTSTGAWTAQVSNSRADNWCSIEPTSGPAGNAKITITTIANGTPDDRTATITIKTGNVSKTIHVSQKQKNALTVTSNKYELPSEGGEVTIEVKANINYECMVDESAKNWITYTGTRALTTSSIALQIAENKSLESRAGKVYIIGEGYNEAIDIYQAGSKPSIVISKKEYIVSSEGETITVDVSSNVDVEVKLPNDIDWVTENKIRSTSTDTYRFDIASNEDYDQRTAEIEFINKENNLFETIKIIQAQKDAIVAAKESYTVGNEGGEIQIEVGHNVDFDVAIDVDWITLSASRALSNSTLVFNIAENPTQKDREGTITFTTKNGGITQKVKVLQKNAVFDTSIDGWEDDGEHGGTAE